RKMKVEMPPEHHEMRPVRADVALRLHPVVLVVAGKHQRVGLLRAYESLVVVDGGVDQVAKDFLRRPHVEPGPPRRSRCMRGEQLRRKAMRDCTQFARDIAYGHGLHTGCGTQVRAAQATGCGLPATGHALRATGYWLLANRYCLLPTAYCLLPTTNYQ